MKKEIGTFLYCSNCKKSECCTDFTNIDDPLITQQELKTIEEKTGKKDFAIKVTKNLYKIKTNKIGQCFFYENHKCQIYSYRPIDCRLYPFGIVNKENKYYLVLYKNPCKGFFANKDFIDENISQIELLIKSFENILDEYVCENVSSKLNAKDYVIIKEIVKSNNF